MSSMVELRYPGYLPMQGRMVAKARGYHLSNLGWSTRNTRQGSLSQLPSQWSTWSTLYARDDGHHLVTRLASFPPAATPNPAVAQPHDPTSSPRELRNTRLPLWRDSRYLSLSLWTHRSASRHNLEALTCWTVGSPDSVTSTTTDCSGHCSVVPVLG